MPFFNAQFFPEKLGDETLRDDLHRVEEDSSVVMQPYTDASSIDDLAKSIVEAAATAAKQRSRLHTVVYSARPLDDDEMEAVATYVHNKLDSQTDAWLDSSSATDVHIVVDGKVIEGTLDINDEPDLENVVDESLIMGIKIVRGDTVIDGSLRHRLDELKHSMHS